jgi:hypothetical protein
MDGVDQPHTVDEMFGLDIYDIDALKQRADDIMKDPETARNCLNETYEKYKQEVTDEERTKLESKDFRQKMGNFLMFGVIPTDTFGQKFVKDVMQAILTKVKKSFTSEEIRQLQSVGFPASGGGRRKKRKSKKRKSKKRRSKKRRSRTRRRIR